MKNYIYIFLLLITSASLFSQPVPWQRIFGGPYDDQGYCVQQTFDGGYIFCGMTRTIGNQVDIFLVKTDYLGNLEWSKIIGNTLYSEYGGDIQLTSDSGFIIGGYLLSSNSDQALIIKTNKFILNK